LKLHYWTCQNSTWYVYFYIYCNHPWHFTIHKFLHKDFFQTYYVRLNWKQ
jgi:hypothetical protein